MKYPVIRSLVSTFYPLQCLGCNMLLVRGEELVCLNCIDGLIPLENFEQKKFCVDHLFWGVAQVHRAYSLFSYVKEERLSKLIHEFKYQGKSSLGDLFAEMAEKMISAEEDLKDVDGVFYVPMHQKKERKRGYNQAKVLAERVSEQISIPVVPVIKRIKKSETQTSKNVFDRHTTLRGKFGMSMDLVDCKHLLLIDDVVTTGATAAECVNLIHQHADVKISVIAIAHRDL